MKCIKKFALLFLIGFLFITFSCKKYLDKKPNNLLVVPTTLTHLQSLLDDAAGVMNRGLTPSLGEASSDNLFLLQSIYDQCSDQEKDFYRWQPVDYFFQNDWSKGYAPIYNSNYCLEMINEIPLTASNQEEWKNVKGSALFFRAYNFLNLLWNHSKAYDESGSLTDLGIALRLKSDFNDPTVRASVANSYAQVIRDTKESIEYLPNVPLNSFRPSKQAAYGLLSRTYLSMRLYDSSLKYVDLCLKIRNDLINLNQHNTADFFTPSSGFPFKIPNKEIIFVTEMNSFAGITASSKGRVNPDLYSSYSNNDIRKTAYFQNVNGGYYSFKGSYSNNNGYFTGIAIDEMFLTRAELSARKGDKDSALADLNTLLINRWTTGTFVPVTATDAEDALKKILVERRKELLFRGLRWMDIKRLNKEGANITLTRQIDNQTYTLLPNSNYYALPLPADIIAITGIPQNPY